MTGTESRIALNSVDTALHALSSIGEYPHFHWVLSVAGQMEPPALAHAVLTVMRSHPNLATRVRSRLLKLHRQTVAPEEKDVFTFVDLAANPDSDARFQQIIEERCNHPLDHAQDAPIRVLLVRMSGTDWRIVFSIDHSSLDGIRSLRFIQNVIDVLEGKPAAEASPIAAMRHTGWDELFESVRRRRPAVSAFYRRMLGSLFHRFFVEVFRPPTRISHDMSGRGRTIGHCFGTIGPDELRQIRLKARAARATFNDTLLASCFRAIERWNRLHGRSSGKISIMVPIDIGARESSSVLTNQVSYVSLPTSPRDRANPFSLLRKVREDMASLVENGAHYSMICFLHFASYLPHPLARAFARFLMVSRVYVDTIMLTNLGVIWPEAQQAESIGSARIEDVRLLMPVATPMGLSLGISTYNGRLSICLGYLTAMFSEKKAREFLALYLEDLQGYPIALPEEGVPATATA